MLRTGTIATLLALSVWLYPARADRVLDTLALLQSENFKVRAQSALVLGALSDDRARVVRPLVKALRDSHRAVRAAAAMALGKLGEITTVGALAELVADEDRTVAEVARRSTERIVSAFVAKRGPFDTRQWAIQVTKLQGDPAFKDHVVEQLLVHRNIDVGSTMAFDDDEGPLAVELELGGDFAFVGSQRGTLRLTLALRAGGVELSRWERLEARGATRDEVMRAAAGLVAKQVLGFLKSG